MSDIRTQFVEGIIPSSQATLDVVPGTSLLDITKGWMIPANPMSSAGNGRTTGALDNALANVTTRAIIQDVDLIRFDDGNTKARNNQAGAWLMEYQGPAGGVNEVIVRAVQTFGSTAAQFDGPAISGITDITRCVPFLFVQGLVNNANQTKHTARATVVNDGVNNVVRINRVDAVDTLNVTVYVVEFVGSNWTVRTVTHTFAASNVNEDEAITAVTVANSFVYSAIQVSASANRNCLYYVWLTSTTNLRHRILLRNANTVSTSYVISNPQMAVTVLGADPDGTSDLAAGGATPEVRTVAIGSTVPDLTRAFIFGHLGSDTNAATDVAAVHTLMDFQDASTVRLRRSSIDGATEFKIQVIDLSTLIGLAINSVDPIIDGANFNINGSFGTVTAVTLGGVSQVAVSANATTITRTGTLGTLKYGVPLDLVVTAGGVVTAQGITIEPPATKLYVNLGTLTQSGQRITTTPDLAPGDQIEWTNVVGGVLGDVEVFGDGSFNAAPAVTAFDVRVNDGTGWGLSATQTVGAAASDADNIKRDTVTDFTRLISFALTNIKHDT